MGHLSPTLSRMATYRIWASAAPASAVICRTPSSTARLSPIERTEVTSMAIAALGNFSKKALKSAVISARPV